MVVGIDACTGPARGRVVFEAKDSRCPSRRFSTSSTRRSTERDADFAVLVVPTARTRSRRGSQPLREYKRRQADRPSRPGGGSTLEPWSSPTGWRGRACSWPPRGRGRDRRRRRCVTRSRGALAARWTTSARSSQQLTGAQRRASTAARELRGGASRSACAASLTADRRAARAWPRCRRQPLPSPPDDRRAARLAKHGLGSRAAAGVLFGRLALRPDECSSAGGISRARRAAPDRRRAPRRSPACERALDRRRVRAGRPGRPRRRRRPPSRMIVVRVVGLVRRS